MKMKSLLLAAIFATVSHASAALYNVNNVVAGDTSDYMFLDADGLALSGGIVTLGYFPTGLPSSSIANIADIVSAFSIQASGIAGTFSEDLEGSFAGFVQVPTVNGAIITAPNTLIGQSMYVFAGNAPTLAGSTAWALAIVGEIGDDVPFEQAYSANPAPATLVGDIGKFGTYTGDVGLGGGTYNGLQLVPEPSAALLGALGALGLLRRRRI